MRIWTVHSPPAAIPPASGDEARFGPGPLPVLVREGFAWPALFLGPFWLLWHREWLALLGWLVLALLAGLLPGGLAPWAGLGLQFLLAASAHDLRRWTLARHGWRLDGVVAARDEDAALVRLLDARPSLAPQLQGSPA